MSFLHVRYVKNFDGDSITFNIPDTPDIVGKNIVIRLRGIDTAELRRYSCQAEKKKAEAAKKLVESSLKNARTINLHNIDRGKYFRILADIEFDGQDLASLLLKKKLAVPYWGKTKTKPWCQQSSSHNPLKIQKSYQVPPQIDGVYVWPPPPTKGK